jgi:DNA invertase Pin-like site-specific DNA recombinase
MSSTNKKALVYVRSARYWYDDIMIAAIQRQTDELKQAAAKDGYTDVTAIDVTTRSGKPEFDSLVKEVENGEYGAIYVYDLCRISRDYNETRKFFDIADELGVTVNVATQPQLSDGSMTTEQRELYLDLLLGVYCRTTSRWIPTEKGVGMRSAYRGKRVGA